MTDNATWHLAPANWAFVSLIAAKTVDLHWYSKVYANVDVYDSMTLSIVIKSRSLTTHYC